MNPTYPPYAPAKLAIFSNISNPTKAMLTHLSPSPPALPPRCGLVPSGTRRAWCADSPFRGLRLARPPLRYASGVLPPLRTPVTDCPHAPRLRPSPPPDRLSLLPASSPALPPRRGLVPSGTRRAWCVGSPLRGLRLARPPLRYASRRPPSAPNPGY